jgi:cell wall-associated NlpC family hydrolase
MRRLLFTCTFLLMAIPLAAGADEIYKVRKGDNLYRIAKKFRVSSDEIVEANGLESDLLKPGDRLSIPTGETEPAASRTANSKQDVDRKATSGEQARAVDKKAAAGAIALAVDKKAAAGAIALAVDKKAAASANALETCLHTVEKGETLTSIADLYDMSVKELKALNRIRRPRKLRAGAQILVYIPPQVEPEKLPAPGDVSGESRLARELKELAESPPAKKAGNPDESGKGTTVGAIKDKLIRIAQKMLDIPYRFGGSSFLGIDCSGFVQKVYGLLDVVLPRTAREQFSHGEMVEKENLSAGDLVFFRTYAKYPSHVGIYLGNNEFIHASSKDRRVKIDNLDAPYYYKRFIGARRLPLDDQANEI